jgi:integrase/recombinase XerD
MRSQNYSELRPNINIRDEEKARFSAFLNELGEQGRAPKTIGSYRSDWLGFTDWYEGGFKTPFAVNELTAEVVKQYRDSLVEQGLKPATVNRKLVFLKRYTKWSTERGFLTDVMSHSIKRVKPVAQAPRQPRGLSELELKRFLREVEMRASVRDQAIVYTLLESGMRVSEIVKLHSSEVIETGRKVTLIVDDIRPHGIRTRRITINGTAKRKLLQYLIERGTRPGFVFQGERGPLTANAVQRIVRKYCGFAKVKVCPSVLRHTFANMFLAREGDVVALADLLGHESLETTRLYIHSKQTPVMPAQTDWSKSWDL